MRAIIYNDKGHRHEGEVIQEDDITITILSEKTHRYTGELIKKEITFPKMSCQIERVK